MRCPSCGEENSDRARFCMICATPLSAGPAAAPREERRVVSVLFADLVGFTARSDRADPEDVRGTLVPFHRIAKEEIERHGGTLDKFIGDAAMGVFGVPAVHEDDPRRAVDAGLAIQRRVGEFARANPARAFHVRVAVETGEAVVTLATGPQIGENVVGDVVNTASRLQSLAPAGGVVVGEGTHRAVGPGIEATAMEPVAVKGKAEPLRVWHVHGRRATAAADAGPFVGRAAELRTLVAAWTAMAKTGSARGALVVGEAGIGKSRLLGELRSRLGEPAGVWLQGTCPPYGEAATFRAFADVVRAHAGVAEDAAPGAVRTAIGAALDRIEPDRAERHWLRSRLLPLVQPGHEGESGIADREELFGACERFLRGAARAAPLVVVLEDLHVAEPAMSALALHLVRTLDGAPVLVLGTAREELFERDGDWREAADRPDGPVVVRVARLSDEEVRTLVAGLAAAGVPGDAEGPLVERSGGNPLFARELVRMVAEAGGAADPDAVPDTVQAVVAARIDLLPASERSVVQSAAVVGASFWPGAVASVATEDPGRVAAAIEDLVARGLVREHQSSVAGEREFSFAHVVIRDVAYGQISRRHRVERHVAIARWMEARLGGRAAEAEALAHHYAVAVDLTRATGNEPPPDVLAAARRSLALAGDRSAVLDPGRATGYFLRALELTPPGDPDRPVMLAAAARSGRRSGRIPSDDVVRMLEEASAGFLERNDRVGAGETTLRLSMQLGARGQGDRARSALATALGLLEGQPGAGAELALAYATLGEDAALRGRFDEALTWIERALAEEATDEARIMALQIRGDARCSLGDLDGVEDLRASVDEAERRGLAVDAAVAHSWLAEWRWLLEGPAAGAEEELRGEELADRRGLAVASTWSRAARLGMLYDLGRWDELLDVAGGLLERDRAAGRTQITGLVTAATAPVLVHRGRLEEALEHQPEMLASAREAQDLQFLLPALAAAATAWGAAVDASAVGALAREFIDAAHGRPTVYREVYGPHVVRACLATGNRESAALLAGDLAGASPRQQAAAVTVAALLDAAAGRPDRALAGFDDAERRWKAHGHVLEEALAAVDAARCLAALGRVDESDARAAAGAAVLRSIGADALAAP